MRPWLEMQINSNQIPGLIWINKDKMIFQIPWKHAAKHGWDMEKDACLFRSWAIHTGRYKVGEKDPDPKTWKANFRCAMNSLPDIEEVKDKSINKGSSAVRVYRMLPPLTKDQKKERKSKSSREARNKSKRKLYEDMRMEESAERLTSTPLPDDHSSYTAHDYTGQEVEVENTSITLDLSSCEVSGSLTDWRMPMEIAMADSTNDIYQLQVSPLGSSSEGWCCFLPTSPSQHSPGALAGWRQGCRGAKRSRSWSVGKAASVRWIWVSRATTQPEKRREEMGWAIRFWAVELLLDFKP